MILGDRQAPLHIWNRSLLQLPPQIPQLDKQQSLENGLTQTAGNGNLFIQEFCQPGPGRGR